MSLHDIFIPVVYDFQDMNSQPTCAICNYKQGGWLAWPLLIAGCSAFNPGYNEKIRNTLGGRFDFPTEFIYGARHE